MTASSKARLLRLLIASLAFALIAGCTTHRETSAPPDQPAAADDTVASAPAAPEAKIHISYAHPGDFLDSLSVTKYSSADPRRSRARFRCNLGALRYRRSRLGV